MDIYLSIIGKSPYRDNFDFAGLINYLNDYGYEFSKINTYLNIDEFTNSLDSYPDNSVIICTGKNNAVKKILDNSGILEGNKFLISSSYFIQLAKFDKTFVKNEIIDLLSAYSDKAFSATYIKTFNIAQDELYDLVDEELSLAPEGITFNVYEYEPLDCTLVINYLQHSENVSTFNEIIFKLMDKLDKYIYATNDTSLFDKAAKCLLQSKRKLSVAESFTGGGIASSLIGYEGMSSCLIEGLVTYATSSKYFRLGVNKETVKLKGTISAEVAYEMALGLLKNDESDIAISTTGNAGPDVQNGNVGLCYIAVGDKENLNIFKKDFSHNLEGIEPNKKRGEIIRMGIKYALFELIKFINK